MLIDFSNENIYKSRNHSQRNQMSEIYNSNQKKYDKIFFGSEESLIDKRFNNLKYNLIPKNSNKNTNRTEYNNQYIFSSIRCAMFPKRVDKNAKGTFKSS